MILDRTHNKVLSPTRFPDGTSQMWSVSGLPTFEDEVAIVWFYENDEEFLPLMQLGELLRFEEVRARLIMPYYPYARQDKGIDRDACFARRTFDALLTTYFSNITTFDIHSTDGLPLFIKNLSAKTAINNMLVMYDNPIIVFPDKGAERRYGPLLPYDMETICATKHRDPLTGHLEHDTINDIDEDRTYIIIDDICDGGRTLKSLAEKMCEGCWTTPKIHIYVSHGIFSKGIDTLRDSCIENIHTTNSYKSQYTELIPAGMQFMTDPSHDILVAQNSKGFYIHNILSELEERSLTYGFTQ